MTNLSRIKYLADKSGFYFKKDLGQSFLIDANIARKIADAAAADKPDAIIEVGPGFGAITELLCAEVKEVVAIEIDPVAVKMLSEALGGKDNLKIVHADFLKYDLDGLLAEFAGENKKVCAVSNLPYYITSPVIIKLLKAKVPLESVTVMLQKEAALRLNAKVSTRDYSSFTVAVNYYAQVEKLFDVTKNVFYPAPKIDSSVVRLIPRKIPPVNVIDKDLFFETVKAGFSTRRKTLLNCVSAYFSIPKASAEEILNTAGIPPSARAETLDIRQFAVLADAIYKHRDKK